MYGESNTNELVQQAASALILEGFEENQDLWLPHGFRLGMSGQILIVSGPHLYKYDDYITKGIWINAYGPETAYVRVHPFSELNKKAFFEYANPAFPGDLFQFVSEGICDWLCWWDIFEAEQLTENQSLPIVAGENNVCNC